MRLVLTVDDCANAYVDLMAVRPEGNGVRNARDVRDAKVMGFNLVTLATIGTVALAIITRLNPLWLGLGYLAMCLRDVLLNEPDMQKAEVVSQVFAFKVWLA